ncbi:hypothetical protein RF11_00483 [Thelohanellus kitauei]|uniref:Uncharacterized protein n=1 Tax=Thelohanellus kitauei TaxID=669202 RepID=A0A0C2JH36_THEKT|nr:hypothetical protein RF11_00483 [Thelohanellus kitauei]
MIYFFICISLLLNQDGGNAQPTQQTTKTSNPSDLTTQVSDIEQTPLSRDRKQQISDQLYLLNIESSVTREQIENYMHQNDELALLSDACERVISDRILQISQLNATLKQELYDTKWSQKARTIMESYERDIEDERERQLIYINHHNKNVVKINAGWDKIHKLDKRVARLQNTLLKR